MPYDISVAQRLTNLSPPRRWTRGPFWNKAMRNPAAPRLTLSGGASEVYYDWHV